MTCKSEPTFPAVCVLAGDCLLQLPRLPDASFDLILTSPPYCMGKDYEATANLAAFSHNHRKLFPEIVRLLKPGGNLCWQVGYHAENGVLTPLDFLIHQIAAGFSELQLRNRIIWTFGHGTHAKRRFSGRHETILWYSKGGAYHFDLDAVRVPQKYPGKRHYKGPNKGALSGNPLGKNPGDVWQIPNINANHVEKTIHPCQFPMALAMRLISALVPRGGAVLDPYMGSGTTGAASVLLSRSFTGVEKLARYRNIAQRRIKEAEAGRLKFRSLDEPIFVPSPNSTVAALPKHFKFARTISPQFISLGTVKPT